MMSDYELFETLSNSSEDKTLLTVCSILSWILSGCVSFTCGGERLDVSRNFGAEYCDLSYAMIRKTRVDLRYSDLHA